MTKDEYRVAFKDLILLCAAASNGETPSREAVEKMNLSHLYRAAQFHMLTALCAAALESAGVTDENFQAAKGRAIRKGALLEIEAQKLFARLEAESIWYLPLKGMLLKELYPGTGMREMMDVDILFDSAYRDRVKVIMEEMGFTAERFRLDNHDCYRKEPLYHFEMHTELVDSSYEPAAAAYYKTISSKLLADGESGVAKRLSHEDFYVFMLEHGYKHFRLGGTGLRFLLDVFLYLRRYGDSMDVTYIESELQKLQIADFAMQTARLANNLYRGEPLSEEDRKRLEYDCFSGAKGTPEHILANEIQKNGTGKAEKLRYISRRVFPSAQELAEYYPTVYRHRILLPFLPLYRFFKALLFSRKKMKREITQLKK